MRRSGFTLIEVLVVMIIMAILVGTAVTSLSAGLKSARLRDASRAVQQYIRHAKAVALLKQRPVVITFEEIVENGEFTKSRVSLEFSGDAKAESGATPLGQGFVSGGGQATTLSGQPVDESPAEIGGDGEDTETNDALAAPPREFEGIHVRGELQENREETRARISVFSTADFLLRKAEQSHKTAEQLEKEEEVEKSSIKSSSLGGPDEEAESSAFSAVYEANGRCDPYIVKVWKDGDDETVEENVTTYYVGRFGKVLTGSDL